MSEVYANILESLTSGLYNEINFAVREYLQNAYDAIKEARKNNLPEPDEGYHVDVQVSKNNKIVTVTDNGIGMDENVLREYTSIGGGTKNDPDFAGHKGIGKLSGLRFFEKFVVRTKTTGSSIGHELSWESGDMMNILLNEKEKMKKISYKDFIKDYFQIKEFKTDETSKHYTQIQLINAHKDCRGQVGEENIGKFIKKNCPVPFYTEEFRYADDISKWLEDDFVPINTFINGDKVIYQHYNDSHKLVSPKLVTIKYSNEIRAKAWFSWQKNTAEVIKDEEIKGMRFRCKGICVGDNNLFSNNCMPPGRNQVANWFTGEVIILDDEIKPSTARDRFFEGPESNKLYDELRKEIGKKLSFIADMRSEINAAKQDMKKLEKMKQDGKKNTAILFNNIRKRITELKRYQSKDEYGLNFEIISALENALSEEEEITLEKVPQMEKEIEKAIDNGNKEVLVKQLLDLKDQEISAPSGRTKKEINKHIDQIVNAIGTESTSTVKEVVKTEEVHSDASFQAIVEIIIKYLTNKKIPYDKDEIQKFVLSEFKNA